MTMPPPDAESRRPSEGTGSQMTNSTAVTVQRGTDPAGQDTHESWQCPVWVTDLDTGRITGRCPQHAAGPPHAAVVAGAVRGLLIERSWTPGTWRVDEVLAAGGIHAGSNIVGGVVSALAAEGVIVRVGSVPAGRAPRRGSHVALWVGARHIQGQPELADIAGRPRRES